MPDPIDELSNFEPGVRVNPMPAAEVRRRGDRLRRRNSLMAVGAAVAVVLVATPIAVFSGDGDGGKPQPAPPGLTDAVLLTADEVPARQRLTEWREADPEGEVLACAPQPPDSLDPDASVRRDFEADIAEGPPGEIPASFVRTQVLQFDDPAAARTAYDTATGWIAGCAVDENPSRESRSSTYDLADGGVGEWRLHIFPAPEYCGGVDCGAALFDRMGVAQVDDRLVLVSLAEVGGPLEPKGLDATMDELFQAAVAKASGEILGTPVPPESSELDGFPLDSGMPDESDNSDYRFDPPSTDTEAMIPAGELTACGKSPPDTGPLDRLTTRLTGPSDAQVRELQLLADEQEAVTYVAHLRNLYQSCPTSDSGGAPPTFTTTVGEGALGEESLDIRRASDGIGRVAITVVRIGNAVLVENVSDEGVGAEVDSLATAARENLADVIAAMNELQDGSASGGPEPTPLDFPLETGLPDADGEEVTQEGPGVDVEGIMLPDGFCGDSWPPEAPVGRLALKQAGPEFAAWRELVTFESAHDAETVVAGLRAAVRECPTLAGDEAANLTFVSHDVDSGYDDATFSSTYRQGLGGVVYQFVRVGHAVLATAQAGEWSPETAETGAEDLNGENSQLTPLMCEYTEAGC